MFKALHLGEQSLAVRMNKSKRAELPWSLFLFFVTTDLQDHPPSDIFLCTGTWIAATFRAPSVLDNLQSTVLRRLSRTINREIVNHIHQSITRITIALIAVFICLSPKRRQTHKEGTRQRKKAEREKERKEKRVKQGGYHIKV